jgi:hypothetical protein
MNYELYHDESMEPGYWHGLLFVPVDRRDDVIGFLKSIRREAGYAESEALNFKNLDGQGKKFKGIWFSLQLLHLLLRRVIKSDDTSAVRKKTPEYHADVGLRADYQEVLQVQEVCDVKFVLLKERDAHGTMNAYPDHASKIETTFRFALKGGCHFLFAEDRPITVKKIFFDGHEHYGRSIDKARVLRNLNAEFRPFCTIAPDFEIDERQLRDRDDDSFIMMNFIDNIVSAWRCLILAPHPHLKRDFATAMSDTQRLLTAHRFSGIVFAYILICRSGAKEVMPMSNECKGITEGTAR